MPQIVHKSSIYQSIIITYHGGLDTYPISMIAYIELLISILLRCWIKQVILMTHLITAILKY